MTFQDYVQIELAGGRGGKGCLHFHRTARSRRAGPDGGDGGKGGDLILSPKTALHDLSHLTRGAIYKAENGESGKQNKKRGGKGKNRTIFVPFGTICCDVMGQPLKEIKTPELFLKGGRGGRGNHFFKTSRVQAPRSAQPGLPGERKKVILELKWKSQACLIGKRGVGKTSFLLNLSQRKEKLCPSSVPRLFSITCPADFYLEQQGPLLFVDLPGFSSGKDGKFLKQAERSQLMIFMLSLTDKNPFDSYQQLRSAVLSYDRQHKSSLANKPALLLLTGKKNKDTIKKQKHFSESLLKQIEDGIKKSNRWSGGSKALKNTKLNVELKIMSFFSLEDVKQKEQFWQVFLNAIKQARD